MCNLELLFQGKNKGKQDRARFLLEKIGALHISVYHLRNSCWCDGAIVMEHIVPLFPEVEDGVWTAIIRPRHIVHL